MATIEIIWQQLDSLSDVLLDSLEPKCLELNFDPESGITSLREAVINVKNIRNFLRDAVVKQKLIQLPLTIQNELSTQLSVVAKYAISIDSGNNELVNFGAAADRLMVISWQYNLHNLSEQVVGYLEKSNQLKQLEIETTELRGKLLKALKTKERIEQLQAHAESVDNAVTEYFVKLQARNTEADGIVKQIGDFSQRANAVLATAQQTDTTLAHLQAASKSREAEIAAVQARILEFSKSIDVYNSQINETSVFADTTIVRNNDKTIELIAKLEGLEGQIKDAIERATGYSLFNSFSIRQGQLAATKNQWRWILLSLVILSVAATLLVGFTTDVFNIAFYIKLAISIPLGYSIGFCTLQYSRERKLEEEYAFKANISISLVPYKDLVEKMINPNSAEERVKYTSFLIDAIKEVYSPPKSGTSDGGSEAFADPEKVLKRLSKTLEAFLKPFEPLLKAIRK